MSAGVASINVLLRCVRHRQGTRRNVFSPHVHDDDFADIRCDCWLCHDCWGANLHGPATAASTHEGRRVKGSAAEQLMCRRHLHLHRAVERGFGRISGGWWPAGWRAMATHTSAKALAPLAGPWGCPPH